MNFEAASDFAGYGDLGIDFRAAWHLIDPLNRGTEYTYDNVDRIIRFANVNYNSNYDTYSDSGLATDYVYDGNR